MKWLLGLVAALAACSSSPSGGAIDAAVSPADAPPGSAFDAPPGTPDARPGPDARPAPDARLAPDATPGTPDARPSPDALVADAAVPDAFVPDAAPPDAAPIVVTAGDCVDGKSWSAPHQLDTAGMAAVPEIAVDGQGNAVAVWQQTVGGTINAYVASYAPGSGWSTPAVLGKQMQSHDPRVVLNSAGYGVLCWVEEDLNAYAYGAWYPGTGLQGNAEGEADSGSTVLGCSVAIDDTGHGIALYTERSEVTGTSAYFDEGTFPGNFSFFGPSPATPAGSLISGAGDAWGFYGAGRGFDEVSDLTGWTIGDSINNEGDTLSDATARGAAGLLLYPVMGATFSEQEIHSINIDLTTRANLPVRLAHQPGAYYDEPSGQIDADGQQVVAFLSFPASGGGDVLAARSAPGTSNPPLALLSVGMAGRDGLRARSDSDGNTFVAWVESGPAAGVEDAVVACYSAQHGWRSEAPLETGGSANPYDLWLAAGGHGNAAVVWVDGAHVMVSLLQ